MQQEVTNEQIQKRFAELSDDMRSIITSPEVAQGIENIGRRHKLRIDKIGELVDETGMVMLGFTKTRDFVDNLASRTDISKEQAETIAVAVDTEVFSRMRESLQKIQYSSTLDKRFEESSDYGTSPVRDSMIADIEKNTQTDDQITSELSSSLSSSDYNPDGFNQSPQNPAPTQAPEPVVAQTPPQPQTSNTPAPRPQNATDTVGKDFKKILTEKMADTDSHVNVDPYKESIE